MSKRASGKPHTRMIDWVTEYLELGIQSDSKHTRRAPKSVLLPLAEWYDKTRRSPRDVTREDLQRFWFKEGPFAERVRADEGKPPLGGGTHNQYRNHLIQFLTWLMEVEYLSTQMPLLKAIKTKQVDERDFAKIDLEGLAKMIRDCTDPRDAALLACNVLNAARGSELRALKLPDVDLARGVIHWTNIKKGRPIRKQLVFDLSVPLQTWIEVYTNSDLLNFEDAPADQKDWYVFPSRRIIWAKGREQTWLYYPGKQISESNITRTVQRYTEPVMGKRKYEGGPHSLRRSGLLAIKSVLVAGGADLAAARTAAQRMADHLDPKMTDHYTGDTLEDMVASSLLKDLRILPGGDTDGDCQTV